MGGLNRKPLERITGLIGSLLVNGRTFVRDMQAVFNGAIATNFSNCSGRLEAEERRGALRHSKGSGRLRTYHRHFRLPRRAGNYRSLYSARTQRCQ